MPAGETAPPANFGVGSWIERRARVTPDRPGAGGRRSFHHVRGARPSGPAAGPRPATAGCPTWGPRGMGGTEPSGLPGVLVRDRPRGRGAGPGEPPAGDDRDPRRPRRRRGDCGGAARVGGAGPAACRCPWAGRGRRADGRSARHRRADGRVARRSRPGPRRPRRRLPDPTHVRHHGATEGSKIIAFLSVARCCLVPPAGPPSTAFRGTPPTPARDHTGACRTPSPSQARSTREGASPFTGGMTSSRDTVVAREG